MSVYCRLARSHISNNRRIDEQRSVEWNFLFLFCDEKIFFAPIDVKQYTASHTHKHRAANFDMKNHFGCLIWLTVVNFRRHEAREGGRERDRWRNEIYCCEVINDNRTASTDVAFFWQTKQDF